MYTRTRATRGYSDCPTASISSRSGNVHLQELGDSTPVPEAPYPHQEPPLSPTSTGEHHHHARPIMMGVSLESRAIMNVTQATPMATDHQLHDRHHQLQGRSHYLTLMPFRQQRNLDDPNSYRMENKEVMRIQAERAVRHGTSGNDGRRGSSKKELEPAFTPMEQGHSRSELLLGTEASNDNSTPHFGQGRGSLETMWLGLWRLFSWLLFPTIIAIAMSGTDGGRHTCPLEVKLNGSCPLPSLLQGSLTPHTVMCCIWPFSSIGFLCPGSQKYHKPYTCFPPQELPSPAEISSKIEWIQTALITIGKLEGVEKLPAKLDELSVCLVKCENRLAQVFEEVSAINKILVSGGSFSGQGGTLTTLLEDIRRSVPVRGKEQLTEEELSLITQLIEERLDQRLESILRPDYALLSAGGRIIHRLTTPAYRRGRGHSIKLWDRLNIFKRNTKTKAVTGRPPEIALIPDVHAGECWAIDGGQGQIAIQLARPIVVTAVTIDHADPRVVLDVGSAPREIEVWSLSHLHRDDNDLSYLKGVLSNRPWTPSNHEDGALGDVEGGQESVEEPSGTKTEGIWWREGAPYPGARLLTIAEYHTRGASEASDQRWTRQQTFSIPASKQYRSTAVLLRINSNWGHPNFTCLYHVQVHGHPPE